MNIEEKMEKIIEILDTIVNANVESYSVRQYLNGVIKELRGEDD